MICQCNGGKRIPSCSGCFGDEHRPTPLNRITWRDDLRVWWECLKRDIRAAFGRRS